MQETLDRIEEIERQLKTLKQEKEELQQKIASNFFDNGGLELLRSIKWYCFNPEYDRLDATISRKLHEKIRIALGFKNPWGSALLDEESNVRININDDDEVTLYSDLKAPQLLRKYELKVDLKRNRGDLKFQESQLEYIKEQIQILEEFE